MKTYTACLIIIGNEILSGRTQDKNLAWIAAKLNERGIRLMEARVVMDIEESIIEAVNACRSQYDYVFTTGGIGPTHDDITSACIAQAFGVKLHRHPDAERALRAHYTHDQINEARLKMSDVPEGAELIANPVSIAPGFKMENVYVMAGVPKIMQAMFDGICHSLAEGAPMQSTTISVYLTEGTIAADLTSIQQNHPELEIGSYPFIRDGRLGTSLVVRGLVQEMIDSAAREILAMITRHNGELVKEAA